MELNRNHYFLAGVVVLLLGIQLRMVDSYVLTEQFTKTLNSRSDSGGLMNPVPMFQNATAPSKKVVKPPEALGWALISIGSVLILHALAMKAPGAEH